MAIGDTIFSLTAMGICGIFFCCATSVIGIVTFRGAVSSAKPPWQCVADKIISQKSDMRQRCQQQRQSNRQQPAGGKKRRECGTTGMPVQLHECSGGSNSDSNGSGNDDNNGGSSSGKDNGSNSNGGRHIEQSTKSGSGRNGGNSSSNGGNGNSNGDGSGDGDSNKNETNADNRASTSATRTMHPGSALQ